VSCGGPATIGNVADRLPPAHQSSLRNIHNGTLTEQAGHQPRADGRTPRKVLNLSFVRVDLKKLPAPDLISNHFRPSLQKHSQSFSIGDVRPVR
jgi:hypothetical protein